MSGRGGTTGRAAGCPARFGRAAGRFARAWRALGPGVSTTAPEAPATGERTALQAGHRSQAWVRRAIGMAAAFQAARAGAGPERIWPGRGAAGTGRAGDGAGAQRRMQRRAEARGQRRPDRRRLAARRFFSGHGRCDPFSDGAAAGGFRRRARERSWPRSPAVLLGRRGQGVRLALQSAPALLPRVACATAVRQG